MKRELLAGEKIFVIDNFLTQEECDALIARGESLGFEAATLGDAVYTEVRNNSRVIFDDAELAASLWQKALPHLPAQIDDWFPAGFNERFRFYRYGPGELFKPHYDGCFRRNDNEVSLLTFMVYLNAAAKGGETRFFKDREIWLSVATEPGKALVFEHLQLHEGAPVEEGCKYVLRTDVVYRRR